MADIEEPESPLTAVARILAKGLLRLGHAPSPIPVDSGESSLSPSTRLEDDAPSPLTDCR